MQNASDHHVELADSQRAQGKAFRVARPALIARILAHGAPIIVLEAGAGMGKSVLLQDIAAKLGLKIQRAFPSHAAAEGGWTLWDLGPTAARVDLPSVFEEGPARLLVAKRPETEIIGLARAVLYGRAEIISAEDLLFSREELVAVMPASKAEQTLERSGGWPLLLRFHPEGAVPAGQLAEMLENEFLRPLSAERFVALGEVLAGRAPTGRNLSGLGPIVALGQTGVADIAIPGLRPMLGKAYHDAFTRRAADPAEAARLAQALLDHDRTTEAILVLQRAGDHAAALDVLKAAKGHFYIYRHGQTAFETVLAGFPLDFTHRHETLVLCHALQALKRGDVARARQLISDHVGSSANQPFEVFSPSSGYSVAFRFFRLLMLIYEDVFVTDDLLQQIFGLISELPGDAHLERGSFYNSLLELYIRRRRSAEAEDVAVRALQHYAAAKVPILEFYVNLHRAIMRLMQADANEAHRFAASAAANLAACGFDTPNDARLLALLTACIDYEGGHAEPLARFLADELDDFSRNEIWPTVIDLALHYGSQALSEHFSTIVARSFLDRWRVYQAQNRQFQSMIDIREATVLQNGNRWQEAADKLQSAGSRISREWVEAAGPELARLGERDEIALAFAWLRQLVFETPNRPHLDEQLDHLLANLQLTGRQRISVEIWQAYLHRRRRDFSRSRTELLRTLEWAARRGVHGPLAEERFFLNELIGNRQIQDFLHTVPHIRQMLRRLADHGIVGSPLGTKTGLSRRETKVLMMISEGSSSKLIAHALGVTEATVKYHLGNIYRKLGCKRRREAIHAARALGLIS